MSGSEVCNGCKVLQALPHAPGVKVPESVMSVKSCKPCHMRRGSEFLKCSPTFSLWLCSPRLMPLFRSALAVL